MATPESERPEQPAWNWVRELAELGLLSLVLVFGAMGNGVTAFVGGALLVVFGGLVLAWVRDRKPAD